MLKHPRRGLAALSPTRRQGGSRACGWGVDGSTTTPPAFEINAMSSTQRLLVHLSTTLQRQKDLLHFLHPRYLKGNVEEGCARAAHAASRASPPTCGGYGCCMNSVATEMAARQSARARAQSHAVVLLRASRTSGSPRALPPRPRSPLPRRPAAWSPVGGTHGRCRSKSARRFRRAVGHDCGTDPGAGAGGERGGVLARYVAFCFLPPIRVGSHRGAGRGPGAEQSAPPPCLWPGCPRRGAGYHQMEWGHGADGAEGGLLGARRAGRWCPRVRASASGAQNESVVGACRCRPRVVGTVFSCRLNLNCSRNVV